MIFAAGRRYLYLDFSANANKNIIESQAMYAGFSFALLSSISTPKFKMTAEATRVETRTFVFNLLMAPLKRIETMLYDGINAISIYVAYKDYKAYQ